MGRRRSGLGEYAARRWAWWKANYPDVARFVGLVVFVYGAFIDKGRNPALLPAATGLIFLKTVLNGGSE